MQTTIVEKGGGTGPGVVCYLDHDLFEVWKRRLSTPAMCLKRDRFNIFRPVAVTLLFAPLLRSEARDQLSSGVPRGGVPMSLRASRRHIEPELSASALPVGTVIHVRFNGFIRAVGALEEVRIGSLQFNLRTRRGKGA